MSNLESPNLSLDIIYDHQIFESQKYGGISRYFMELLGGLSRISEVRVHFFGGFYTNEYLRAFPIKELKGYLGYQRPLIRGTERIFRKTNTYLFKRFVSRVLRSDSGSKKIYHQTYYNPFFPGFTGKRIVTVYDMIHELFPQNFSRSDMTSALKKNALRATDGVIAISNSTKNDLVRLFGVDPGKIRVIHLAGSLHWFKHEKRYIQEPYVLYVGARSGYKNFSSLARVFTMDKLIAKNFKILCFGGGPFTLSEKKEYNKLSNSIIHISGNDELLSNLYTYASAFVYPSLYEGFGIPPLEAMSCGCPVICSSTSSMPEVVGDSGLYFNPEEPEELLFQLKRILNDAILRNELIQKGYIRAKQFSWEKTCKETLDLYQSL